MRSAESKVSTAFPSPSLESSSRRRLCLLVHDLSVSPPQSFPPFPSVFRFLLLPRAPFSRLGLRIEIHTCLARTEARRPRRWPLPSMTMGADEKVDIWIARIGSIDKSRGEAKRTSLSQDRVGPKVQSKIIAHNDTTKFYTEAKENFDNARATNRARIGDREGTDGGASQHEYPHGSRCRRGRTFRGGG